MKKNELIPYFKERRKRVVLITHLTALILLLPVFGFAKTGLAQQQISMEMQNASLQQVLEDLHEISGYYLLYNLQDVKNIDGVTIKVDEGSVEDVLTQALTNTILEYTIENGTILIRKVTAQQPAAEQKTVIGVVKDNRGETLVGATVRIKGTTQGTATDVDGNYTLRFAGENGDILVFSFIGMKTKEIRWEGQTEVNVTLEEDINVIDEVVVTGMFEKRLDTYTGAVTTITAQDIKNYGSRNLIQTIANLDPGLRIIQDNVSGSDPNKLPNLQLRGASNLPSDLNDLREENRDAMNTPLILLDGFEISLEQMLDLNEHLVDNITILKDAAATALYGSRAANGVIVITTKAPEEGRLIVSYFGGLTIEVPDLTQYRLLNAREKMELEEYRGYYSTHNPKEDYAERLANLYRQRKENIARGVDTYWLSQPLRTSLPHSHTVNLMGGSKNMRYGATVGYAESTGVMKGSNRQNINGKVDISYHSDNFRFSNSTYASFTNANNSNYGSFSQYAELNPYNPIHNDEGKLIRKYPEDNRPSIHWTSSQANPLYNASLGGRNETISSDFTNNFSAEWKPIEGMTLYGRISVKKSNSETHIFVPAANTIFDHLTKDEDIAKKGSYNYSSSSANNFEATITGSYNKLLAEKHLLYAGMDIRMNTHKSENISIRVLGYPNPDIPFFGSALMYDTGNTPSGSEGRSRSLGITGNANYSYDSRYFVDASLRLDGSSTFGDKSPWGTFWSAGIGWNMHNEDFFAGILDYVNQLKIRGSYGVTGAQNFSPYQSKQIYQYMSGNDRYGNWLGAKLAALGNENLSWQETRSYNLGIDAGFLKGRLSLTADVYLRKTMDLLSPIQLPYSNGFTNYMENVGEVENKGVELRLTAFILRNTQEELFWTVTGSLGSNKNKLVRISDALKKKSEDYLKEISDNLGGKDDFSASLQEKDPEKYEELVRRTSAPNFLYKEGESMRTLYAVRSLGINPANGEELFLDRHGNVTTVWSSIDQVPCGVGEEKIKGNINTNLRYKRWSMSASLYYTLGADRYNSTYANRIEVADFRSNVDRRVYTDRWKKPGDRTLFKSIYNDKRTKTTSRFIQKENSLSCSTLQLNYELGELDWVKRNLKTQAITIGFQTNDLFYLTTIKRERGTNYPFSRRFAFNLTAIF